MYHHHMQYVYLLLSSPPGQWKFVQLISSSRDAAIGRTNIALPRIFQSVQQSPSLNPKRQEQKMYWILGSSYEENINVKSRTKRAKKL